MIGTDDDPSMTILHTRIDDASCPANLKRATFLWVHGFAENSDFWLEPAIQFALNGFECHMVDLRGFGLSGGTRAGANTVEMY